MPIDSNILPNRGTWNGITYSRRIKDLIEDSTSGYITTVDNVKRRYNGNSFVTYAGGEGRLNSAFETVTFDNNVLTSDPALESRPVNISLVLSDVANVAGYNRGNYKATLYNKTNDQSYICPVISFRPDNICLSVRALVAHPSQDMESESLFISDIAFNNLLIDTPYEGIMENGISDDEQYILVGWYVKPYLGNATSRTYTERLGIMVENSPASYSGWDNPELFYEVYGEAPAVSSGIRQSSYYWSSEYNNTNYSDRSPAVRLIGGGAHVFDGSFGASSLSSYTFANSSVSRNSWGIIPDSRIAYKYSRWADYPSIFNYFTGEEVLKNVAAFGLFFALTETAAASETIGASTLSDSIYLGVMDDRGYTYGNYVRGRACASEPQSSWTDAITDAEAAGFAPLDPSGSLPEPPDPNTYDRDNETVLPSNAFTSGNDLYAITIGALSNIISKVNLEASGVSSTVEVVQEFLTNNPIDVIKGVLYYPFNITEYIETELTQTEIILGNIATGINGYKVAQRAAVVDAGSCTYYPPNGLNDFRSYEPYSSAELYIPYCGSVKISPSDYIGHKVGVKYLIDIESGGCIALVYRDNLAIDAIAGQIGVSCPITGVQTSNFAAAQEQAQRNSINSKIAIGAAAVGVGAAVFTAGSSLALTAAAVGGVATLTTAGTRLAASEYELEHQKIPYKSVGSAGAATATANEQFCRLVIHRPVLLEGADLDSFGEVNGFACCITAQLASFTGFTQVSLADLSGISCTASERSALLSALQSGVIL